MLCGTEIMPKKVDPALLAGVQTSFDRRMEEKRILTGILVREKKEGSLFKPICFFLKPSYVKYGVFIADDRVAADQRTAAAPSRARHQCPHISAPTGQCQQSPPPD